MNFRSSFGLPISLFLMFLVAGPAPLAATNAVPLVNQPLVPAAVAPGGAGFTLTVNCSGFVTGAVVQWNGSTRVTTFVSSSQLTAAILSTDIATAGTARITVVNPAPGGGTSNIVLFPITKPTTNVAFSSASPIAMTTSPNTIQGYDIDFDPITADVNGDGKADLISLSTAKTISVRLGNGDGTFQPAVQYAYDPNNIGTGAAQTINVGDFNGDGKPDIIVMFSTTTNGLTTNNTAVLLGNGNGTFQSPVGSTQSLGNRTMYRVQPVDLNADGKLDIVGGCGVGASALCTLLGNGDGTFTAKFIFDFATLPLSTTVESIAVGDFNGDGKPDIVVSADPAYLFLLLGNGDGTFPSPTASSVIFNSYAKFASGVVAADLNGDGKLDLAYYHDECGLFYIPPCGHLEILLGNGNGTFQSPLTLTGLSDPVNSAPPVVGDFNGDGKVDLAFGNNLLLLGTTGSSPYSYSLLPNPSDTRQRLRVADFNGDGRLDLAAVEAPGSNGLPSPNVDLYLQTPPPPDFSISATPGYLTLVTGNSGSYTIQITAIDGFNGVATPTVTGLPTGAAATFNPTTVTASGSMTLTVSTSSSTPTGSYSLTVTLTSGSLSHGGGLTLNVGPSGTDFRDFTGSFSTTWTDVVPGGSAGYGVTIQPLNGFTGNVSLSVSGLPAGATYSFTPATIIGGSGSSNLVVVPAASTPTGIYPFLFTATSGSITHSTTLVVNVGPAGTNFGDITGTITPTSQTVAAGSSTTFTITVQPLYGCNGSIALSLTGLPTGAVASGNSTIPGCSGSSIVTITTSSTTPPGTYTLVFTASGGFTLHQGAVTLIVTP